MGKFITADEMKAVADTLNFLNAGKSDIRFEVKVLDSNGDSLGTIEFSESGYVFYLSME